MDRRPDPDPDDGEDPAIAASAAEPMDDHDLVALAALARAVTAADPPPPGLVDRAQFAVALEEVEVEVASIQRNAAGADQLAGVRSVEDQALTMTFTAASLSLTLAVTETARARHRLDGWVTTDGDVVVTLRLGGDADQRRSDVVDGRFAFDDVPSGMVQVVVATGDEAAPTVVTPVFEL